MGKLFSKQVYILRFCFAVASVLVFFCFLSACGQKTEDITLPMTAEEVSSAAVYRQDVRSAVKKVVTDPQDIAAIVETINDATVDKSLDPKSINISEIPIGGPGYGMAFYLSDGRVVCFDFLDCGGKTGRYRDTNRYLEVSNLDISGLWDELNYEEQEALSTEEPAFDDLVKLELLP